MDITKLFTWMRNSFEELKSATDEQLGVLLEDLKINNPNEFDAMINEFTVSEEKSGYINSLKKGGKLKNVCKCGCALIPKKEKGGTIQACGCGCATKQKGGQLNPVRVTLKDNPLIISGTKDNINIKPESDGRFTGLSKNFDNFIGANIRINEGDTLVDGKARVFLTTPEGIGELPKNFKGNINQLNPELANNFRELIKAFNSLNKK